MSGGFDGFPRRLVGVVDGVPREWVALDGWHAVRGDALPPGAAFTLEDEGIAVYRGASPPALADAAMPVYGAGPNSAPRVPTALVFVRFAESTSAEARRPDLERAGYMIVEIPGYAPHAAWVKAASDSVRDALAGLSRLVALPGVRTVEPQLLGVRALRR